MKKDGTDASELIVGVAWVVEPFSKWRVHKNTSEKHGNFCGLNGQL